MKSVAEKIEMRIFLLLVYSQALCSMVLDTTYLVVSGQTGLKSSNTDAVDPSEILRQQVASNIFSTQTPHQSCHMPMSSFCTATHQDLNCVLFQVSVLVLTVQKQAPITLSNLS